MRELVTVIWCDVCKGEDKQTEVKGDDMPIVRVTIDGRPYRLDVCGEHANPNWNDILNNAWPDEAGEATKYPRTKMPCRRCGAMVVHMAAHLRRVHGIHAGGDGHEPAQASPRCPLCQSPAKSRHGVTMHMVRFHKDLDAVARNKILDEAGVGL